MRSLDGYFLAQINIPLKRRVFLGGKAGRVRNGRSVHDDIISFITEL